MTQAASEAPSRPERRRREVADAARRVILRKGLERTTLRDISREAGFTTGVLSHYFPDKQAVIVGAFLAASDDYESYVQESFAAAPTPKELLETLVEVGIPEDPARRAEWRLWSEMWTYAGHDRDFADQLVVTDARWERMIASVLARARDAGLLRAELDAEAQAGVVARLIDGLGLRAWLSGDWERARLQLVAHLATLGLPGDMQKALTAPPDEGVSG